MDDHYDGVVPTVCGAYLSCVEVRGGVNHAARDVEAGFSNRLWLSFS